MKETLLSFSDSEICCLVIAEEGFADGGKKVFGIPFTLALFVIYKLMLILLC